MKILQFFQGPGGENSSKRLAGLATTFVTLGLAIVGGYVLLKRDDKEEFLALVELLLWFAASLLISGVAEFLIKKKYGKTLANTGGN